MAVHDSISLAKQGRIMRKHLLPGISNHTFATNYPFLTNAQHRACGEALMLFMVHRLYF